MDLVSESFDGELQFGDGLGLASDDRLGYQLFNNTLHAWRLFDEIGLYILINTQ